MIAYTKIDVGKASWTKLPSGTAAPPCSQPHRFQLKKRAQQFVRMDDVAFAVVFIGINDPAPTIARDVPHDQPAARSCQQLASGETQLRHGSGERKWQ
jgi:hypothetical protein